MRGSEATLHNVDDLGPDHVALDRGLIPGPDCLFQGLDLLWRSPESSGLCYKFRQWTRRFDPALRAGSCSEGSLQDVEDLGPNDDVVLLTQGLCRHF